MLAIDQSTASYDIGSQLSHAVNQQFSTSDITVDSPEKGFVRLRGQFLVDLATDYDQLRDNWAGLGYTPLIRKDEHGEPILIAQPGVFKAPPLKWKLSLLLFVLTVISTMLVGYTYATATQVSRFGIFSGWPFSLAMLLILGAHELGHYFASRYHKVDSSLPYFIPFPTILGTMGAVIVQRQPPKNRRALLDVGAAGPLIGLLFAIPILFLGLALSDVEPLPYGPYLMEGNSLFYALAKRIVFGRFLPADGIDVSLNQIALAGWAGLLVTAINLMPVGQLDGGHMVYVLFGDKARYFLWPTVIALGLISYFYGGSWWLWIVLLIVFGKGHPPPDDDVTPLDPRRRFIAIFSLSLFFVLFTPTILTTVN